MTASPLRGCSAFFAIVGVLFFMTPTSLRAAEAGCCVVLAANKTEATNAEDVTACFPLLSIADCNAYKASNGNMAVWREQGCTTLDICVGKSPSSCCAKTVDAITESCFPVPDKAACDLLASHSKSSKKVGKDIPVSIDFTLSSTDCTNINSCAGKISGGNTPVGGDGENHQIDIVPPKPIIPQLAIQIPGLKPFTGPGGSFKDGYIIPYIGQYIAGIYGFLTGAVATLAIAMIIFAGMKWQMAAGDSSKISSAKTTMTNAVIGLLLALGTYLILYTLNPALVEFKALRITTVQGSKYIKGIPSAACSSLTGAPVKSSEEIEALAKKVAAQTGIPELPCIVIASIRNESGGQQCVVGHDENATSQAYSVEMRRKFQKSGTKASGASFAPVDCNDRTCQANGPINDDEFKPDAPPDYGLDWNYSHGFGPGQSTIFPNSPPCEGKTDKGRGFRTGGTCYTIPELLSAETSVEIMVKHFKSVWNGDVRKTFVAYAGKIDPNNPIIEARMKDYDACRAGK